MNLQRSQKLSATSEGKYHIQTTEFLPSIEEIQVLDEDEKNESFTLLGVWLETYCVYFEYIIS